MAVRGSGKLVSVMLLGGGALGTAGTVGSVAAALDARSSQVEVQRRLVLLEQETRDLSAESAATRADVAWLVRINGGVPSSTPPTLPATRLSGR
jgi:hypothetical protein